MFVSPPGGAACGQVAGPRLDARRWPGAARRGVRAAREAVPLPLSLHYAV